jgi:signal transduction histidine kinase
MTERKALAQLVHDLNQPLSAINNYAQAGIQLIDNGLANDARLKDLLGKIAQQCQRATALGGEIRNAGAAATDATDPA